MILSSQLYFEFLVVSKLKMQWLAGLGIHAFWSPVLTQIVLFYYLMLCDDFKWGKIRDVVEDTKHSTTDVGKRLASNTVAIHRTQSDSIT